jgi:predicted house-cleaning noncanonical NTP pyrophosphatase (MazG superfamily)
MIHFHFKLVRDLVPRLITTRGAKCLMRQLEGPAYVRALANKIVEEAKEVRGAGDRASLINELADLAETVEMYRMANNIPIQDVEYARQVKAAKSGNFAKGYYVYAVFGSGKPK